MDSRTDDHQTKVIDLAVESRQAVRREDLKHSKRGSKEKTSTLDQLLIKLIHLKRNI